MKHSTRALLLTTVAMTLLAMTPVAAQDWPQWRGVSRDGRSVETDLLDSWPSGGPELLWRTGDLGDGFAGISVVGNRLYTLGGMSDTNKIVAIDTEKGNILWSTLFGQAGMVGNTSSGNVFPGPRCTPTVDGHRIFAVDHHGELICVNAADGNILWSKHYVNDLGGTVPKWGYSESPLVDGERLVVTPGGPKGAMVALNKNTGDLIWQSNEFTDSAHYASIIAATIDGIDQYVQLTSENVVGISPTDGSVLWKAARSGRIAVIPTPIVDGNFVYVTSGYNAGCSLFKVASNSGVFDAEQVYANRNMVNHHGGVIKVGDYLYGYSDRGGLTCQAFTSGEVAWAESDRIGKGAVSFADGMLYFREEKSGDVVLVEATPTGYSEKGRFKQPDRAEDMAWPHPVISHGMLYIRDQENLFCYALKAE